MAPPGNAQRRRLWLAAGFSAAAGVLAPAAPGTAAPVTPATVPCVDLLTPENVKALTGFTDAAMVRQGSTMITQLNGSNGMPAALLAIMQASEDTGVSFELLAAKAMLESRLGVFNEPLGVSGQARGLYQFMPNTWLVTFKNYGGDYNNGQYKELADQITVHNYEASVRDAAAKEQILALRSDPYVAAFVKAKFIKVVEEPEARALARRDPTPVDFYLLHLLGTPRAETFFKRMRDNPSAAAARTFAREARFNDKVFFKAPSQSRSYQEVYDHISAIIDRYLDRIRNPAPLTPLAQGCVTYLTYGQTPPPFAVLTVRDFPPPRPQTAAPTAP